MVFQIGFRFFGFQRKKNYVQFLKFVII
jgi:hypothetical protein